MQTEMSNSITVLRKVQSGVTLQQLLRRLGLARGSHKLKRHVLEFS